MNEKELDELMNLEDNNIDNKMNKKIKKEMRKQIYKRVIIVLIVIAVIWQGVCKGTSYIFTITNYNPYNEVVFQEKNENIEINGFDVLMSTVVSMYFPGKLYEPGEMKKLGYGKYEVSAKVQEIFEPLTVDGVTNVTFNIHRSNMIVSTSISNMFSVSLNEYYDENASDEYNKMLDDVSVDINDIKELPDSAVLDVAISFSNTYTLKQTIDFMKKYNNAQFVWIATHVNNQVAEGMSIYDSFSYELDEKSSKQYPHFYLWDDDKYDEEILTQNYLSKLQLLKDHQQFVELVSNSFIVSMDDINERYENVKKNGISCIGLRGYIKKQDLLSMMNNENLKKVFIHDVKLSSLQK